MFEAERPKLVPYAGRFDGFHAVPAAVSKTCLVRFDNNKYSVAASAVGRPVEVHAYADRIVIRQDGRVVAEHCRSFGRGVTVYDPWHYVPVLARKPGALRNGAPFKDWVLPAAMERIRRKLAGVDDGNRQMVDILTAVLTDGLPAVEAACAEAIDHGVHSVAGVGREQFVGQNRVFCVREVFWLIGSIAATRRTTKWGIRSRPFERHSGYLECREPSTPRVWGSSQFRNRLPFKLVGGIRGNPGLVVARCSMNSNWAPLFVAGSLLVLTTDIAAQEQAVLGQGNVSCGSWLNDRKGDDTDASSRIAWVLGYVTAFNQYESKPAGDVSGAKGTEEIMAWIDNYCGRHPSDNLYRASAALVDEFRHKLGR